MKTITSRDNAFYKELKQLASNAAIRRKLMRTVLDGVHLCQVYLQQRGLPLVCVVSESAHPHPEVHALLQQCEACSVLLPDALYQTLSQVEHGLGIFFVIKTPQSPVFSGLQQNTVLLDNLQDPGNLGSILRSAAAAGIKQILCSSGTASAWSPKVLRAGMGAHFLLEIFEQIDLLAWMQEANGRGFPVLATSSHASKTIYQTSLQSPLGWLFGHEGQGVSPNLLAQASAQITIPHQTEIESLNVAACAAICFFEQVRQNQLELLH
jgi:RNA methyltransferase, TrmH family